MQIFFISGIRSDLRLEISALYEMFEKNEVSIFG